MANYLKMAKIELIKGLLKLGWLFRRFYADPQETYLRGTPFEQHVNSQ